MRAEPCDWPAGAQCIKNNDGGVTAGQAPHNSSNVGVVTTGQVGHNSSMGDETCMLGREMTEAPTVSLDTRVQRF